MANMCSVPKENSEELLSLLLHRRRVPRSLNAGLIAVKLWSARELSRGLFKQRAFSGGTAGTSMGRKESAAREDLDLSGWRGAALPCWKKLRAHPSTCSGDAEKQHWPCQTRLEGTVGWCRLMADIILPSSRSGSLKEAQYKKWAGGTNHRVVFNRSHADLGHLMGIHETNLVVNVIRNFTGITEIPIWISRNLNVPAETVLRTCFTSSGVCRFSSVWIRCWSISWKGPELCCAVLVVWEPALWHVWHWSAVPYALCGTAADLYAILSIRGPSPGSALPSLRQSLRQKIEKCRSNSTSSCDIRPPLLSRWAHFKKFHGTARYCKKQGSCFLMFLFLCKTIFSKPWCRKTN